MKIKKEGREIDLGKVKKVNFFGEAIGLMFCRREKANSLLFEFKKPTKLKLHSYFVFFPFIAIWLDNKNNVLGIKKVKPFKLNIGIKKHYHKLVEIPINKRYNEIIELLDDS
ncbi:DUF192 domain-containing protein [Candidatus Pacearchaeota archaeon]|nr:DUF192 domain-containing protein [Candidatus Pacearchaeota archaeon]